MRVGVLPSPGTLAKSDWGPMVVLDVRRLRGVEQGEQPPAKAGCSFVGS